MLPAKWQSYVDRLDYAFQPIVGVGTGNTYGFEALLRGTAALGFPSIAAFFDSAYAEGILFGVETALRFKAIERYLTIANATHYRLFCNVDNRIFEVPDYRPDVTINYLRNKGIDPRFLCIEISEAHSLQSSYAMDQIAGFRQKHGLYVAIDDFGIGYSGLQMLYRCSPDLLKIDRFFTDGIAHEQRKRLFVRSTVQLAHTLGIGIIAEGVETIDDYRICCELGVTYIQGYFLAKPTLDISSLSAHYPLPTPTIRAGVGHAPSALERTMVSIPILDAALGLPGVLDAFSKSPECALVIITGHGGEPLGLVRERDAGSVLYNPFGHALLKNKGLDQRIGSYLKPCPAVDINTGISALVDSYVASGGDEGVIITQDRRAIGFLPARTVLGLVAEHNIALAQDQNPLTGLPGNRVVLERLQDAIDDDNHDHAVIYFDFDHFKPFNDRFGFHVGDRAILLFADTLRSTGAPVEPQLGHLGGDDFLIILRDTPKNEASAWAQRVRHSFQLAAMSFFSSEEQRQGFFIGVGRDGIERPFPLLTTSAGLLSLAAGHTGIRATDLLARLPEVKRTAKNSSEGIGSVVLTLSNGIDPVVDTLQARLTNSAAA
jgi:diguanylate cyclase (GGDEF)-like protein